ncbi:MAG: 3-isopropylmalate dehydratase large subunit [Deltaproteobacteria bacterium]|nr:3-isopropylmalate dehydratase large subunit [Deltaproteobacteria bacterium]
MGQTFAEKLLAKKSGKAKVDPGEIVEVSPDLVMSHNASWRVIRQFRNFGGKKVLDPERIVMVLDHRSPADSAQSANNYNLIREFAAEQQIKWFYGIEAGICHQVLMENGHVLPGTLIPGTDSHCTTYGALGAFGTGIGFTEVTSIWVMGKLWLKVPESVKIVLKGRFHFGTFARDLMLSLSKIFTTRGCSYKAVEFHGPALREMDISERTTLANVTTEMGAKTAYVEVDEVTRNYLKNRAKKEYEEIHPDPDANYHRVTEIDLATIEPSVALPHRPDNVVPISQAPQDKIHEAYIGSCTNGNLEDLAAAARVLKGRRIHPGTRLIVTPATKEVYLDAIKEGYIQTLVESGAAILNAGCGACAGGFQAALGDGERCIASINRNFMGRMANPKAFIFLASPATVAATAIEGKIADPRKYIEE